MPNDIKLIDDMAVITTGTPLIVDTQSALNFIVSVGYEYNVYKFAVNKSAVSEDFFNLATGFAGEVIQKFVNYGYQLAIIGDFSEYTSKSLRAYIYECNNGRHVFFVSNENEAIEKFKRTSI
jgi:hypothetical protein